MSRKNVLLPIVDYIKNASMTSTVTGPTLDIQYEDSIGFQIVWTGTPSGTFDAQGSFDGITWASITLSNVITASGSAGNGLIDMFGLSFPKLRLVYNPTGSTGTLNVIAGGKNLSS